MNKLYQELNNTPNASAVNLANMYKSASNPQALLTSLAGSNPAVSKVLGWLKTASNPREAFYAKAKEMGVNPNTILNLLK